jgi:hypothetical protein
MSFDLSTIRSRPIRTAALEDAYRPDGTPGVHLPTDSGPQGERAREEKQRFRDSAGNNHWATSAVLPQRAAVDEPGYNGIPGCHVYSAVAFEEFRKHKPAAMTDWLYRMLQNSGCCVGASWQEGMCQLLGIKSADTNDPSLMFCLSSMIVYAYRDHCGGGWYMSACAREAIEHGWLPATILDGRTIGKMKMLDYRDTDLSTEQKSENAAVKSWCRGRVPRDIEQFMSEHFQYERGAISELDSADGEIVLAAAAEGAFFHHGSNSTAGSGGLDRIRRIGGHAQTGYGADASEPCIDWFKRKGVRCSKDNFIMPQGQTWGGNWSGEIDDSDWPFGTDEAGHTYSWAEMTAMMGDVNRLRDTLEACRVANGWGWGPKHQGAWLVTLDTYRRYLHGDTYVYLPQFDAIPGDDPSPVPPPVSEHPDIEGTIYAEEHQGRIVIRGLPVLTVDAAKPLKPGAYKYAIKPEGGDRYSFEPLYL